MIIRAAAVACTLFALATTASAQTSPKTLVVMSPFNPGAATDIAYRAWGEALQKVGGPNILINPKPGGQGQMAAAAAQTPAPAGMMNAMIADNAGFTVYPHLFKSLTYNPEADFKPVSLLYRSPLFLAVPARTKETSLKAFVAALKTSGAPVRYGTQAIGASGHILGSALSLATGIPMVAVHYKGGGPAAQDLAAGEIDFFFNSYPPFKAFVTQNRIHILAVTSDARQKDFPDIPTVAESGFPMLAMEVWFGLALPKTASDAYVEELSGYFAKALAQTDITEKLADFGLIAAVNTPAQFRTLVKTDSDAAAQIIRDAGIKAE
ncbi:MULTISPECIES: tripartite tricarboxylate transporter substrate binding protein [unclassified Beijerinckia]|uniref:Bug family tripartite tricarboxylate transporter substrate binding protein n=1 Tax=unclassified Beijerinckia TaxID=2638183 RepID=UPI00089A2773|nr:MULTISPECIES: tripartite tricarboxylate transporter substrate binding protein [unclassified Beijerinckia]MDH7796861.1 tripartite-type tricarboxylate transporter receptor subunit TctC [Beijerinckia sp. GAS462]SEC62750.1 Tripartite-type tricarboxylate transporter, receptor component TctC [Beijerinckia sp. 28-YEA-48]